MVVVKTGIPDLDRANASMLKSGPEAADIADVALDETNITVSKKTRNLQLLGQRPSLQRINARSPTIDWWPSSVPPHESRRSHSTAAR